MTRALGRYELLRPLGRGGMAEVFLARRRAAGVEKLLVVKRIRPERANDVEFLDLFVREARLSMTLTHQNIVPVFDFGRAGDQVYFAMERVEGRDLGSSFARVATGKPRMPAVVAAFVAAECCQALDYAHRRRRDGENLGIVHRDVTPRNVLVSWSGEVKLTDFGIAALAGDETSKLLGTPGYMAPEQARKEAIDARTDVYAVGLLLREALTGQRARPGSDREALLAAARSGELPPWPDEPRVAAALVAIVDRATSLEPADRYPDARAMLEDLDAYIVVERAANPGDAPARRLATWVSAVWEGEREDTGSLPVLSEPAPGADHLVSFFDDEGAIGTGTQRSLLATAADEADARPPDDPTPAPAPPPPVVVAEKAPAPTARAVRPATIALFAIAALVLIIAAFAFTRERERQPAPSPSPPTVATTPGSARAVDPPQVAAGSAPQPPAPRAGSASNTAQPPDPGAGSASNTAQPDPGAGSAGSAAAVPPTPPPAGSATKVAPPPVKTVPKQGSATGSAEPPPPVAMRRVCLQARPWAKVRVDGDPTEHDTPWCTMLTVGVHRVLFANSVLKDTHAITVEVIAGEGEQKVIETMTRPAAGSGAP